MEQGIHHHFHNITPSEEWFQSELEEFQVK